MIEGIDAATERLYRGVLESPLQAPFIRRVDELCKEDEPAPWSRDAVLVIVPGASYREIPSAGTDGRLVREEAERIGCPIDFIPVATTGTLRQNARTILDWLAKRPDRPVVLASLSKGGPDIKTALTEPDAEPAFRNVKAWINLCGLLDGTPMADWLLSRSPGPSLIRHYYRLRGRNLDFLNELRYRSGGPLDSPLRLLPHVQLISVAGFPLREHLTRRATRRTHAHLESFGPNDGALILEDVCALPGLIYPVWGADHYLQPEVRDIRVLMRAILRYLDEALDR
ncbi:MAG TPA: hypothetical protein VH394_30820 [Thermoanaerobaculia bacterium]|nr:hypothetical protein [Thermoanaerobaculia bacterium]